MNKIGYDIGKKAEKNLEVHYQRTFDFMPELAMFITGYTVKKTFSRQTQAPRFIKDSICFYFKNILRDNQSTGAGGESNTQSAPPCVHVFSSSYSFESYFEKGNQVNIVTIFLSASYLKSFLKNDIEQFGFLFNNRHDFLIEEIMTDDIVRTVNDFVKKEEPGALIDYHYKLKAMELLFHLFISLSKRERHVHNRLNENDIKSIYKVRNKLISSLSKPTSVLELKLIAGMNELKMRNIFTQVFGMGIYDYYQYRRMKEATRLLREERFSVSEVGYQLGFENLSHFSRVFEKHIGIKPKKYSML
ncbi:AraC family transcriptional regulator [Pedobacter lusitanus]|uniref:AraC family transcriptional regulator n=2 Tax=Pedobacter lusitanus TaxID=1503925 RepID=A0A0D0GG21_9SPHI|nr:AraC family transcriptional regulator [Pedobacter lusitanus]